MKAPVLHLSLLILLPCALADDKPRVGRLPATCEVVMTPGMRITATTPAGKIAITAVDEVTRAYTWDGATRAVEMAPRADRWYGSLGLCNPGAGEHWRDHHGITRSVTEEGQQHFKTVEEATEWIKKRNWMAYVYRDDGLVVGWHKNLARKQLNVEVWQILIDGKKPKGLPGSHDDRIDVATVETETVPLVKAVATDDLKEAAALLAKRADANVKNSVEVPVLVMAIRRGSIPMVAALLKNGADPNVRDLDTDFTPLLEAMRNVTPEPKTAIVRLLLAAGADVNAAIRNEADLLNGLTPLMLATAEESGDLVQLLLDKGANVHAKTGHGMTALERAKLDGEEGNQAVIRKLEAAAAKK